MRTTLSLMVARAGLGLLGLGLIAGCTSTENLVTDLITGERDLPHEVREHEALSPPELVILGQPGIWQFEAGRRFEAGVRGFPKSEACALLFFDVAGRTRTAIRADSLTGGAGQRLTYLGLPQGRAAARRLAGQGVTAAPSIDVCLHQIPGVVR